MTTVAEILKSKADPAVYAAAPSDTVYSALRLMADKGIGALLVKEGDTIVGIFTERDYARKVALLGRTSDQTRVRDVMTDAVLFVEPSQTTDACMQLMTSKRLRHLPVMDGGQLVGLISIGDLVKQIISEQQFTIAQLEHYIHGGVHS
ncbi:MULTISPECIES: CBS domain-containing protein [Comamonas]|uniref:CBS domain-containing protein n=1 Tax=Comamonas TaxID=283 RepID=UPI0025796E1F|nr:MULTISPECIES: CBS domain-containing protein [Comamonas]